MTENVFEGRCKEYIYCSIAYYMFDHNFCHDHIYDNICKTLQLSYNKLPKWFRDRVSVGDLKAGTGFTFKPTKCEIQLVERMISGKEIPPNLITDSEYKNILRNLNEPRK